MASVTLEGVRKIYEERGRPYVAVHDFNVAVADGEFLVLVGPSGCGKSTTLRLMAGFLVPDSGRILADVFFSVGNPCLGGFLGGFRCADYSARVWQGPLGAGWAEYPVVFPIDAPVMVTHTSVRLGCLAPGQQVELRLLARPALGYVGEVSPPNAALQVQGRDETFTVTNVGTVPLEQARLAPRLPMPAWLWAAWACPVCVVGFGALEPRRPEAVSEAPRAAA